MLRDLINLKKLRDAALYLLFCAAAVFLQDSVIGPIRLFGVSMMFVPAAAVAVGYFAGGVWGAAFGLVLGFLSDISFGYVALFVALFPLLGFFAGVLSRWYVNAGLFAYMCTCLAAFAITAAVQVLFAALGSGLTTSMLVTALIQTLWSLPMAAVLYYPARAIGRPGA